MDQSVSSSSERISVPSVGGTVPAADTPLKVFISYSRKDSDFANELLAGLEIAGFEPFLDTHDIAPGEPWETRLGRLIDAADTVVFVISPNSIISAHCNWEVERTEGQGKRLLPIVWQTVPDDKVPARLKRLNYIYFDKPHSFAPSLASLSGALRTDLGWVREHTRLLTRAQEWLAATKPENRLLSGKDIADAKSWLEKTGASQHLKPTELHRDFIQASEQAEILRLSAERARADELQSSVWRTRLALAGTAVFLLLALCAAGLAYWSEQAEKQQKAIAEQARAEAESAKAGLAAKLKELERSEDALTAYIKKTAPKISDQDIRAHIGDEAIKLIVASEVGGQTQYDLNYQKPVWAQGESGINIGIGYDLGYHSIKEITADWHELPPADLNRLISVAGITGTAAAEALPKVADITIPFDLAMRLLVSKTIIDFGHRTVSTFPSAFDLPPESFGALVSLVYNRGNSLKGDRRGELRAMRSLLILGDYKGVAQQFRDMKRLWPDAPGLQKRREAEAKLFEAGIAKMGATTSPAPPLPSAPNSHTP